MRQILVPIVSAAVNVAALLTTSDPACAQANRTFVSGARGADTNPCTLSAPCRTFTVALGQTNAGGEIAVLDTAGYGAVTITKSVSIVNEEGVEAGITVATATDGIDISGLGSSDVVNLRGLTLTGGGVGANGINFSTVGALNIQNCVIRGFGNGIAFAPSGAAALNVSDTIVSNSTIVGAGVQPSNGGTVKAVFNRVQSIGAAQSGFLINGTTASPTGLLEVTIANSAATNNSQGIAVGGLLGGAGGEPTVLMVSSSVVSNNITGVGQDSGQATTYLAKNTIAGNSIALANVMDSGNATGQLFSFGDNYVRGNKNDSDSLTLSSTTTK